MKEIGIVVIDLEGQTFMLSPAYQDLDEAARACADLNAKTEGRPYYCQYIELK